ncbi:MAG: MBL fold metallo-hydrolase [Gammaproteobacteria bacterium]
MSQPRLASAVILTRGQDPRREVYLVKRSLKLEAFAGQWAFPGGKVDELDQTYADSGYAAFVVCAVREILEETGVFLADGEADTERLRQELLNDNNSGAWPAIAATLEPDTLGFTDVCEITTPPISRLRFKTRFLHIQMPQAATPEVIPGELDAGDFFLPAEAIKRWEAGDMVISPPVLFLLRLMRDNDMAKFIKLAAEAARNFEQGRLHPAYFSPGIFLAPLQTPTIPPATTTNTLITGNKQLYIIDPATPDAGEQQKLFQQLDDYKAQGKQLIAILLTHHHPDHVGAVNVVSQRYQLPVRAHPETYGRIQPGFIPGKPLLDGEKIALGEAPDGSSGWQLEAVYTPGHAVDHFCFIENRYHAAIVGDMLSTISTIVIDPPEGHMRTYLDSLHILAQRRIKALFPAHGHVYSEGSVLIREYLRHRQDREQLVIDALTDKPQSLSELVAQIYSDIPAQTHRLASRSLLAGLIKLQEDGISEEQDGGWCKCRGAEKKILQTTGGHP